MSTWLYLECLDHDPVLSADGESGQHLYDLPQIRSDIADRDAFLATATATEGEWPTEYFRSNTARFLRDHPKCRVGIRDEYGREHSLTEGDR